MANNIMTYMLSRNRYGGQLQSLVSDVARGCGSVSMASFFPILRPLTAWMSGEERRIAAAGKRMDAYLQSLLDASREHPTTSDAMKTLVDVVLEFERDDGAALDDRTRKCVLLELILAGTETVATMVEWTMAELFRNPDVMHKVQSELDDVVGTLRFIKEEDLPNLSYLTTLFQETSRLHPPSPLLFPHQITRQTQINGYDIPAHSHIILNTWAIGRDSKMWDHPKDYNPERFMENNKKGDYKGQSLNFLPFGVGGSNIPLEYNVVMLALGYLCQSFEWTLPTGMDPKTISTEEQFGLACTMKHPLQSHYIKPRLELHLYAPP
jgi:cytochrome P450